MTVNASTPAFPEETHPYWEAAREGRLLVKHCRSCSRNHHYPRSLCPHCLSAETEWRVSSGRGTVYSFTGTSEGSESRILAFVTLEEEVVILTHIVGCALDQASIGMKVEVIFEELQGVFAPVFRPC